MKVVLKPRFKWILLELEDEGIKLKQADIARKLGVSREAVSKYFNGSSYPSIDKAFLLSKILNRPIEKFYEVKYSD
jgi:transcriptional regulator with XRE-family HTH domain